MPTKQGAFLLVSIFHRHSADLRSAARLHGTGLRVDSRSALWSYTDKKGRERVDPNRLRVRIKYIDNKRALIDFGGRRRPDKEDLIPEDSKSGDPQQGYIFPGYFLNLRTLAFALTDNAYSLEEACEAFAVEL